ncbi:peroxisomal membrane protein 2-like [Ostrea edulis]|uniref:peroxisomal membrane protein 2-like n=1 Tax=Ostrea edulis TaxID=37623 RepID=UPI002095E622|nr:peroxisomal membrane protein 2-like [Ostrea edulis]
MSLSKDKGEQNPLEKALAAYIEALQTKPVLTKAVTSGCISAIGSLVSQLIVPNPANGGKIVWRSVAAYAAFGFVVSGPLIHKFYILLDKMMPPKKEKTALDGIKRVVVDRLVFAPPFLLLFLYVITILEGQGHQAAIARIRESFFPVLKLNLQVWTVFQYVNVNYVPPKYRVLFGNALALIWSVFVASKRRKMALANK